MKTYKGQTAGGILRTARIEQMRAGNYEIVVTTHNHDVQARMTADGELALRDSYGLVCTLKMSCKARDRLYKAEYARELATAYA